MPFEAVTGFFDPSVQFGLKFELNDGTVASEDAAPAGTTSLRRSGAPAPSRARRSEDPGDRQQPAEDRAGREGRDQAAAKDASAKDESDGEPKADESAERPDAPQEGASVVSLDAFRKKS